MRKRKVTNQIISLLKEQQRKMFQRNAKMLSELSLARKASSGSANNRSDGISNNMAHGQASGKAIKSFKSSVLCTLRCSHPDNVPSPCTYSYLFHFVFFIPMALLLLLLLLHLPVALNLDKPAELKYWRKKSCRRKTCRLIYFFAISLLFFYAFRFASGSQLAQQRQTPRMRQTFERKMAICIQSISNLFLQHAARVRRRHVCNRHNAYAFTPAPRSAQKKKCRFDTINKNAIICNKSPSTDKYTDRCQFMYLALAQN